MIIHTAPRADLDHYRSIVAAAKRDPGYFSRVVLGHQLWSKQLEIKASVRANRRTLVRSGHGTGKSHVLADLVCEILTLPEIYRPGIKPNARIRVVLTAGTNSQLHDVLWTEVRAQYAAARYPLGGRMLERAWQTGIGRGAICVSVDDPVALQGKHADLVVVIVDEAEAQDAARWAALDSLMSGEHCRMVAVYNPTKLSGPTYEASKRPDLWNQIHVSCLDHPNVVSGEEVIPGAVTRTWVEEVRAREGEDSAFWQSRVLGEHPEEGSNQLVTVKLLEACAGGVKLEAPDKPRMGVDLARYGDDKSVATILDENRNVIFCESWAKADLMASCGRVRSIAESHGIPPGQIKVDVSGLGAGFVDRMREQGWYVDAVDFGAGPASDWLGVVSPDTKFINRRAELYWVAHTLFRERAIGVPARFSGVWSDLVAPTYSFDSKGRIVVEPKDAIKKRLGRSPDQGDSLVLALSNVGGMEPRVYHL